MGKLNNVREALEICRTAGTILGANGISLEYPAIRHMNNLKSVLTYERTRRKSAGAGAGAGSDAAATRWSVSRDNSDGLLPDREDCLKRLFAVVKPVIGSIHLRPLPGAPRYHGEPVKRIYERAKEDARRYLEAGVDGLTMENEGDIPS